MAEKNKETGEVTYREVVATMDNCNRPSTTLEGLAKLEPVKGAGKFVTAGNASQLSDGSAACVMMEAKEAERRGLQALGAFRGFAVAGCEPDEMGIGPVFAVPRLLERAGLKVEDIALWELNEAFASQALYCQRQLGIPMERLNVNGGAISIGHPIWHDGRAPGRTHPARRPAPQGQGPLREVGRGDHVHRRRPRRGRPVRDFLIHTTQLFPETDDRHGPEFHP